MKLMVYSGSGESSGRGRLGVMLDSGDVGDLRGGYALHLSKERKHARADEAASNLVPDTLAAFLEAGPPAMQAAVDTQRFLSQEARAGAKNGGLVKPLAECRLHAPLRPSKLIAVGRNYRSHNESVGTKIDMQVPSAWIKANSAITGPMDDIVKPDATKELDYETELSIVIGKRCRDVPEAEAYGVIAGYTIVNDVSARDIARIERKEANQLLGKMFDTFAPMGPWLVTADEIRDPMQLRLQTRVNGEIRQDVSTSTMIWTIPQLISYISQATLEPGDVITTGTPDGCAMGRKPDESSWYLQPGHVLESEVEGVGVMKNRIVAEPPKRKSWQW